MKTAQRIETETQLVPYSIEMAVVEELKTKYMDVTIPEGDKAAYSMVLGGLRECREIRLSVDGWHKDKKAWIVKAGKHYDKEKNRVHGLVEPIEEHLKAVRKVEDDRLETIKAEQIRIEQERVDRIRTRIAIMSIPSILNLTFKTAADIEAKKNEICGILVSSDDFQEFADEAANAKAETISKLILMYEDRKRLEDEAERLEKVRKEQEAEAARLAAEKKAQDEAAAKIKAEQEAEAKRLEGLRREADELKWKSRFALLQGALWRPTKEDAYDSETGDVIATKAQLLSMADDEYEKTQKNWNKIIADRETARIKAEEEAKAEVKRNAEAEARAKVEREEKERKDREAKAEADRLAKEEADRKEAERKAALAPDKEKLLKWLSVLEDNIPVPPTLNSKEASEICRIAREYIQRVIQDAKSEAEEL